MMKRSIQSFYIGVAGLPLKDFAYTAVPEQEPITGLVMSEPYFDILEYHGRPFCPSVAFMIERPCIIGCNYPRISLVVVCEVGMYKPAVLYLFAKRCELLYLAIPCLCRCLVNIETHEEQATRHD